MYKIAYKQAFSGSGRQAALPDRSGQQSKQVGERGAKLHIRILPLPGLEKLSGDVDDHLSTWMECRN